MDQPKQSQDLIIVKIYLNVQVSGIFAE